MHLRVTRCVEFAVMVKSREGRFVLSSFSTRCRQYTDRARAKFELWTQRTSKTKIKVRRHRPLSRTGLK